MNIINQFSLKNNRNTVSRSSSMFFAMGWCLLIPYFVCFSVLSYFLLEENYSTYIILSSVIQLLVAPAIIIIVISWILLHLRLFILPLSHIATAIARIKEDIKNNFKKPIPIEDEEDIQNPYSKNYKKSNIRWFKLRKWVRQNLYMISSVVVGSIYMGCEIYLIIEINNQFALDTVNFNDVGVLIFQVLAIPSFIILGIVISVSNRQNWMTYTFFPLFVASFPQFAIIPIAGMFKDSYGENLTFVIIIALPTLVIFWLVLAIFGVQMRNMFLFFLTYTCIFFAFPIGFLLPLSVVNIDGLDQETVQFAAAMIVTAGVGIIVLYIVQYIIRLLYTTITQQTIKKQSIDLSVLSYYNLKNMGFLVNSSGFIFGYTLLCYVFYSRPDTASNDDKGFVDAMLINLPLLFLLISHALQTESNEYTVDHDDNILDASNVSNSQIQKSQIDNDEFQDVKKKIKFQKRVIYSGILIPFCVGLPLFIVASDRQTSTRIFVVTVGFPICFLIYWFLIDVKNKSKRLQNFFTPFLSSICWFCVILPLFIIGPLISSYIYSNNDDFAKFMRGVVGTVAIVLICGVTSFSIFVFIIKNQLEQEKKKKFVVTQMLKTCTDNRVKSTINPLAILYDYFQRIHENEEKMKSNLQQYRKPLRYDTKKPDKNSNFEEQIIISKQLRGKQNQPNKKERSKWDICLDYLFCRFGIQVNDLNKDQQDDEIKTVDDLALDIERVEEIMDDYLPKQIKKGYLYSQQENINKNANQKGDDELNLLLYLEKTKEQKAIEMYEDGKNKDSSKHNMMSSKTANFRSYKLEKIKLLDLNKYKYTDHGSLISNSETERCIFLIEIFHDFANEDDGLQESLIYNDFLEFCRLSGIFEVDNDYASSIQQNEYRKRADSIASDLQSFNELDFQQMTQRELSQLYDAHATQFWKGGILVMNLENFSSAITDIANKLSIKKESTTPSLKIRELLHERVYGYLMINIPGLAANYRPDVRQQMDKNYLKEQLQGYASLFGYTPFKEISSNEKGNTDTFFDYNKRGKHNLAMHKEQRLDMSNFQLNYNKEAMSAASYKVQDQNTPKKPKQKFSCFLCCCICMRSTFCVYPGRAISYVSNKINSIIQRLTKLKISQNKFQRKPQVKKAPNWDDMADNLVSSMVIAIKAYEENQKASQQVQFNWNINNVMAIFGKVSDFLTLYGVAFNNSVEWLPGYSTKVDPSAVTSGGIFTNFVLLFWVCFGLGILYFFLAIIATEHAEKGTLGKDENGDTATYRHKQFYLSKGVNFLGLSQFMFIMRTHIDTYICEWDKEAPWPLYRTKEVQCMTNQHLTMMGLGFISLLAYYPLSTFIQPSIQFLDNTLDVKYDKSYVAIYIQAKLVVLGATSFFNSFSNKRLISLIQLSVTSIIGFFLAFMTNKMQPCLIQIINPIEIACLMCIGIVNGMGLVIIITGNSLIGFIVNIALHVIVIVSIIIIVVRRNRANKPEKKKIVLTNLPVIVKTADKIKVKQNVDGLDDNSPERSKMTPYDSNVFIGSIQKRNTNKDTVYESNTDQVYHIDED